MSSLHPGSSPERVLRTYFHAKDGNRPHLLSGVFSESVILEMIVKTGTIVFPPVTEGLAAVTDVLVRRFAQTYENIYSFYLQGPPPAAAAFSCDWLVGMSEKSGGAVRVGCGRYDWSFQQEVPFLADRLVVTIEAMEVLDPRELRPVMAWLAALPYPWCPAARIVSSAPPISALEPVLQHVGRSGNH
jgi:hypothetical protein